MISIKQEAALRNYTWIQEKIVNITRIVVGGLATLFIIIGFLVMISGGGMILINIPFSDGLFLSPGIVGGILLVLGILSLCALVRST